MILQNSFMKYSLAVLALFFFADSSLSAQAYKTIFIKKDITNSGVIKNTAFPKSNPEFTFLVKKSYGLALRNDINTELKTNKIVLFRVNLSDYKHNQKLFLIIKSQISPNKNFEKPLISAFYDTNSQVSIIPEKPCDYQHELLNNNQQISFRVDTSYKYLYLVMAFPNSFNEEFAYNIFTKPKKLGDKSQFDFYQHHYDYDKQPSFFMEALFREPYNANYYNYCTVNLNDPAFEKPHIKAGKDSLFYNEWMINFMKLAENDPTFARDCMEPDVPLEMHYDSRGKLVHYQASDRGNLIVPPHIKIMIRLLIKSLPKTYTWTPALDHEGKAIEYKRKLIFSADFCWN